MYAKESALEKQIFAGLFVGPFLALLTLSIALFNYSAEQMELPLACLVGLYCSWRLRLRGVVIAWVLLAVVTAFKIMSAPSGNVWWNVAFATSTGLACIITALAQRNARDHWEWRYQDSVEQQSRLAIVEGRLNTILQTVGQGEEEAQTKIEFLENELKAKSEAVNQYVEYVETARKELLSTNEENEQLRRDVVDIRQKALTFEDGMEKAKEAVSLQENREQAFRQQEAQLHELQHTLQAYEHQITSYKEDFRRLNQNQVLSQEMGEAIETLTREKKLLENTLTAIQTELEETRSKNKDQDEQPETHRHSSEYRRLEGFHKQLREQFEEKSQILDETRQQLFAAEEKLNLFALEKNEAELSSPSISIEEHVQNLARLEDEVLLLQEENQKLQSLIETLS